MEGRMPGNLYTVVIQMFNMSQLHGKCLGINGWYDETMLADQAVDSGKRCLLQGLPSS